MPILLLDAGTAPPISVGVPYAVDRYYLLKCRGPVAVAIVPPIVTVPVGSTEQFVAIASPGQAVVWSAIGGTITASGLFTATGPGPAVVTARLVGFPNLSATSSVTVPGVQINPSQLPASLDVVLSAVAAMLGQMNQFTPAQSFVSLDPDNTQFPNAGGPFAVVAPGAMSRDRGLLAGAGRYQAMFRGSFTVDVIATSLRDMAQQDNRRLLTPSTGLLALASQVQDAMDGMFVTDASGNFLSIDPSLH